MPPLVLLIFTILIGWPLVKLLATIVSRRRWDQQRQIMAELESDPKYGALERRIIVEKFEEGKGSVGQLALPFVAFFGGLAVVFAFPAREVSEAKERYQLAALKGRLLLLDYPEATASTFELLRDHRFEALSVGASELELLRYPFASIMTMLAIIPSLLLMVIFHGLQISFRHLTLRIVESSQQTVKAFTTLIASATTAP